MQLGKLAIDNTHLYVFFSMNSFEKQANEDIRMRKEVEEGDILIKGKHEQFTSHLSQ